MERSEFYLTLPSNASMNVFPDNTLSDFSVRPPQPIELTGEWEVCLKEIQYPRTWNNVRKTENHFYVRDAKGIPRVFILKEGYYSNANDIIQGIDDAIDDRQTKDSIDIQFDKISRRFTINVLNGYSIAFSASIAIILGFGHSFSTINKKTVAPFVINLEGGLSSIYVYSDVIQAQIVGDSMVPLLRILSVEGKDGDIISKTFQDPPFYPVSRKTIDQIQVNIKDDTGRKVPFESGRVIVQLHFKQRRPLYL